MNASNKIYYKIKREQKDTFNYVLGVTFILAVAIIVLSIKNNQIPLVGA